MMATMNRGMSRYVEKVLSSATSYGEMGVGYDFMLDRANEEQAFFDWSRMPLSTFLSEIAEKTGNEVVGYDSAPGGLVRFRNKIDPQAGRQVLYDSFMKNLMKKPIESVA
jgi:hypothetical protein